MELESDFSLSCIQMRLIKKTNAIIAEAWGIIFSTTKLMTLMYADIESQS